MDFSNDDGEDEFLANLVVEEENQALVHGPTEGTSNGPSAGPAAVNSSLPTLSLH